MELAKSMMKELNITKITSQYIISSSASLTSTIKEVGMSCLIIYLFFFSQDMKNRALSEGKKTTCYKGTIPVGGDEGKRRKREKKRKGKWREIL